MIKAKPFFLAICLAMAAVSTSGVAARAALIELAEFGVNVDGVTFCTTGVACDNVGLSDFSSVPGADQSGFDLATGLGGLGFTVTGAGNHNLDLFLDLDIDDPTNFFFNEFGAAVGTPSAGQSWEIDEPGFLFGDIFGNFLASSLENANGVPDTAPEDVSMALGWDFALTADEIASITFLVSEVMPASGFYLSQTDPDSSATVFFSSRLQITQTTVTIPEPSTAPLFGIGLLALGFLVSRRRQRA